MNKLLVHKNINSFYQFLELFGKYDKKDALWTSDLTIKLSYKELVTEIKNFSYSLSQVVKPGQRVILSDLHGPHWVIAFFSILLNKAIAVPIDQRMDKELQKEIIKMMEAKLLITCKKNNQFKLKTIVYEEIKNRDHSWQPIEIDPNIPAEIIFTSGTWGKPKGVVLTHNNLLSNLNSVLQVYKPNKGEKLLSVLPLAHAYEQMCGLLVPIASGCHIVYQQSLDSFSIVESLQKFKINYMVVVPKFLEILQASILRNLGKYKKLFSSLVKASNYMPSSKRRLLFYSLHKKFGGNLQTFIVGGAPLTNSLNNFFRNLGFNIIIGYGLSESSPVLAVSLEKERPLNSVGYPVPAVTINIADDNEILAIGSNISPGYWPLDKKQNNSVLNTGDLGHLDDKGRLILTGRKKNMVVFQTGDKIQLEDIEDIAIQFQGVIESCAIVTLDKSNQQRIGLIFTGEADDQRILEYLNKQLPIYAKLHFVNKWHEAKLPYSHTLKLRRNIIQQKYDQL